MSARTEFVVLKRMKEKGKLSFEDIKRIIDRSVNKTHEFINNMIEKELGYKTRHILTGGLFCYYISIELLSKE